MKWRSQSSGIRPPSGGKHEMAVSKLRNETTIGRKA
ncbi:hypothetical protein JOC95_000475 [Bacillus tianshenii]|uniref:Uncharacterized protein n=1 Tax=Sutcliffiella tianshenii TaxID=1463404 RepID=A0ABS2NVE8_9BACI|nr:hypothetical protein [Bacillus tianshenii]